jgi:hypothetical protein
MDRLAADHDDDDLPAAYTPARVGWGALSFATASLPPVLALTASLADRTRERYFLSNGSSCSRSRAS